MVDNNMSKNLYPDNLNASDFAKNDGYGIVCIKLDDMNDEEKLEEGKNKFFNFIK
jgi:hypothetical protein